MEVSSATATSSTANFVDRDKIGLSGLTSQDFIKLLITQLENQDPTEPIGNEELLNQLAMMRNLQSNIELGNALKAIMNNQQLSTAASFIGKSVTGTATDDQVVTGIVERAFLEDGNAFVGIGPHKIAVDQVTQVNLVSSD